MAREHGSLILPLPWRGVSIAFSFLLVMLAVQAYLGRFGALFTAHTIFSGVQYTDAHVTITGMLVVAFALLLGAAIAAEQRLHRSPHPGRLVAAIVPALACFIVVQIVGWYVSSFIVKPNQLDRERALHCVEYRLDAAGLGPRPHHTRRVSRRNHPGRRRP